MTRVHWLILVVMATVAAAVFAQDGERPGSAPAKASPDEPLRNVEVKHEFIRVGTPAPPVTRKAAHKVKPTTVTPPPVQRAAHEAGLLEKAKRALVGDGRYRPEPFPRIRNE